MPGTCRCTCSLHPRWTEKSRCQTQKGKKHGGEKTLASFEKRRWSVKSKEREVFFYLPCTFSTLLLLQNMDQVELWSHFSSSRQQESTTNVQEKPEHNKHLSRKEKKLIQKLKKMFISSQQPSWKQWFALRKSKNTCTDKFKVKINLWLKSFVVAYLRISSFVDNWEQRIGVGINKQNSGNVSSIRFVHVISWLFVVLQIDHHKILFFFFFFFFFFF